MGIMNEGIGVCGERERIAGERGGGTKRLG